MHAAAFKNENLILPFPEELNSPEWIEFKDLAPAELFLQAVFDAILSGDQTLITNLPDEIIDAMGDDVPAEKKDRVSDIVLKLAGLFYDAFAELLETIVPENDPKSPEVAKVVYDHEHHDIYLIFHVEDECATRITSYGPLTLDDDITEIEDEPVVDEPDVDESEEQPDDPEDL